MRLSLRKKLFLTSLLILLVPWIGVRYVKAIEDYLQHIILGNLSSYTQSVATALESYAVDIPRYPSGESRYASPLQIRPQMDGYNSDWADYQGSFLALVADNQAASDTSAFVQIARYTDSIYLFVSVRDPLIRYYHNELPLKGKRSADAVALDIAGSRGQMRLLLMTEAPGALYARDINNGQREPRVQGVWRERDDGAGYQVEIKLPVDYVAKGMNVLVRDVGQEKTNTWRLNTQITPLLSAPEALQDRINQLGLVEGRRLRLLDPEARVLVNIGSLKIETQLKPVNPLFAWLLTPEAVADPWGDQTRLEREDIQNALLGEPSSRRIKAEGRDSLLLSSAWPVSYNDEIIAVVLIEESTAALQIMQRTALASLLNLSLVIFLLLMITLIGFAGRLSNRIRRLKKLTDEAIDLQGRVQGAIPAIRTGDELDDLSNHIREMLIRLKAYHDYLEKLASRLSHEIRTPLSVVRSSLENLTQQAQHPDTDLEQLQNSVERANQGTQRLQTLLHRMSEASRLEQSIEDTEVCNFELSDFLNQVVQGYQDIYPHHQFSMVADEGEIHASKELLAQCLDKLIANAVSFADEESTILISAKQDSSRWQMMVSNEGPQLPQGMEQQLFQSMVSLRDKSSKSAEPHLGLGLHIVRLIAEFHGGSVRAENYSKGVRIIVSL